MNLQAQLIARIVLIALICLAASAQYVLYRTDQQSMFEAEQTAIRIEKQSQQQLLQMFKRNDSSRQFPDVNLWQQVKSIPGSCTQFLSRYQSRQRSLCNDATQVEPNWPDWFGRFYQQFFHPDWEVRKNVNFNAMRFGTVLVSLNVQMETARAWNNLQAVIGVMTVTILVFSVLMIVTTYRMLQPAQQIVRGLEKMRSGHLETRLPSFDIAEWKRTSDAINALASTQQTVLLENQQLALKLINAQEEEHRYLSRELHDEFGQCLAGINAVTTSISQSARRSNPELLEELGSISHITSHMMTALRNLLTRIRPIEVDEMGLSASLQKLIRSWNQRSAKQTHFELQLEADIDHLAEPLPVNIYRIIQECLTNIAKHAQAKKAVVSLRYSNEHHLCLNIVDDGIAHTDSFDNQTGMGLLGIHERVSALGGQCQLQPVSVGGLQVTIQIPVKQIVAGNLS